MSDRAPRSRLSALAAIGIVLVVLHLGRAIVVPFLLGLLVAIAVSGVLRLSNRGVPRWASLLLSCLTAIGVCVGLGALFALAFQDLAAEWPAYQKAWDQFQVDTVRWFARRRLREPASAVREIEPQEAAMQLALPGLAFVARAASNFALVLLIALFLLVEAVVASTKLEEMERAGGLDAQLLRRTAREVHRYVWIKTVTSAATGVLAGALTAGVGLGHPLLFGLLAFVLNYIPTVGSLIAMVPAVALGVLTLGWSAGLVIVVGYGVINTVIGLLVEPRWMGHAIGLSPSIVFLSMAFWAFVLGPVGALVSVPLMMIVRIAAEQTPDWQWLATMLASPTEILRRSNAGQSTV